MSTATLARPAAPRQPFSTRQNGYDQILATHCPDCGYNNFPPSTVCANCMGLEVEPLPLSRRGELYSFTTMRAAEGAGMVYVGYVDLPEKIRIFTELAGFDAASPPACGLPVELQAIRFTADDTRAPGPVFVFGQSGSAA